MNNLNNKYHLLYYLNEYYYLFELESTGSLIYKIFDKNMELMNKHTINNSHVLKFNIALDNNKIILMYLLESGQLYLSLSDGLSWTEAQIGTFDTKSNSYHQMELLFINNKVNLIYSYSNYINSEIVSIQHLVLDKKVEEQNNVIKYILKKAYNEFYVDFDEMGTIHLIYNTTTNFESYIYHSFYSPYRGLWNTNPKELSSRGKDNSMPYLFVDSKSNVNTTWLEMDKDKYRLKYAKMPINGKEKYIWKHVNIPISFNNSFRPIIHEEDEVLKIICYDSNSITTIISNDYGNTWTNKGDKQVSYISDSIRTTITKNIQPKLKVKDILSHNTKINDLSDIYFDFIISNNKANIVKNLTNSSNVPENVFDQLDNEDVIKVVEINTIDKANEVERPSKLSIDEEELQLMIQNIISEDKALISEILENHQLTLNEILENQKTTINELHELKSLVARLKPSLINKLLKGN